MWQYCRIHTIKRYSSYRLGFVSAAPLQEDEIQNSEHVVIEYLQKYGFLSNTSTASNNLGNWRIALTNFQKHNNLQVTGYISNETITFINQRRCCLADIDATMSSPMRWLKHSLKWRNVFNFKMNTDSLKPIIQEVFNTWANVFKIWRSEVA